MARLEKVPVYGGSTLLEEGTLASDAFKAQNVRMGERVLVSFSTRVLCSFFRDRETSDCFVVGFHTLGAQR